jgi:hypothetical protein
MGYSPHPTVKIDSSPMNEEATNMPRVSQLRTRGIAVSHEAVLLIWVPGRLNPYWLVVDVLSSEDHSVRSTLPGGQHRRPSSHTHAIHTFD